MIIKLIQSPIEILAELKTALKNASKDRTHNMRIFSVSSYDKVQNTPNSRMVVLRRFLSDWTFRFFTDSRSDKIAEFKNHPFASALFWDSSESLQIRILAKVIIHHDNETAINEWRSVDGEARKAYTPIVSPGTGLSQPSEAHQWPDHYHNKYFAVVELEPFSIQAVQLDGFEHLAAEFRRPSPHDDWYGEWIAP